MSSHKHAYRHGQLGRMAAKNPSGDIQNPCGNLGDQYGTYLEGDAFLKLERSAHKETRPKKKISLPNIWGKPRG